MKLKIISDIHCDINKKEQTKFNFSDDDFVICCGDVSGDRISTENWITENIKQGIIIGGNHLGYSHISNDKYDSLNLSMRYLQNKFIGPIYFLENQSLIVDDVCFIGCILFTDFNLFNNSLGCQFVAQKYLNDFRYVKLYKNNKLKTMSTNDQIMFHQESIKFIKTTCEKYKEKKIVIITHHAPSFKSIAPEYKEDLASAAFASNLEDIIHKYNNIKLWCHGHIHSSVDYKIGGTRIIANPLGYNLENPQFKPEGIQINTVQL